MSRQQDDDDLAMDVLDALASQHADSAAWARRQYARGLLDIEVDHEAGTATLSMADMSPIELRLPWWLP